MSFFPGWNDLPSAPAPKKPRAQRRRDRDQPQATMPKWATIAAAVSLMATGPHDGLVIDNFAGAGGASVGIEEAIGRPIDYALNHDKEAIATHQVNHPGTVHICQDIMRVDPRKVVQGRAVWLTWFSPDCKHHSKAKGGKPKEKKIRDLAWAVVLWARRVQPTIIMLENVEEFRKWGPLDEDGNIIKERMGETWERWLAELRKAGYRVQWKERRASDFGVPTIRKRLFLIARRDNLPIIWPEPTHGKPTSAAVLRGALEPFRTAAECIDFSRPCPSIFERKRDLADATQRRIAYGIYRYVLNHPEPFIVGAGGPEYGGKPRPTSVPLGTVLVDEHKALVTPTMVQVGWGEREGQEPRALDLGKPLGTIMAERNNFAIVMPTLVHTAHGDKTKEGKARGRSSLPVTEPLPTTLGKGNMALVSAFLDQHTFEGRARDLREPYPTQVARETMNKLVAVHIEQANTGMVGHDVRTPLSTIVEKGCTQRVIGSTLVRLNNPNGRNNPGAYDMREPMGAISAEGKHFAAVYAFLTKYYQSGGRMAGQWQDLREPMHCVPARESFALVMVYGQPYVIADIGMRMLDVDELAAAQGFPRSYNFRPIVDGRPLPKTYQVRQIGNSVCPEMSRSLVAANMNTPGAAEERDAA